MYHVKTYNAISDKGLSRFDRSRYDVSDNHQDPHAILLRSHKLHEEPLSGSLQAIARAGAGVNNVPVDRCSQNGIVVFNTPGANANAVKELVLTGMLMACRDIAGGLAYCRSLADVSSDAEIAGMMEKEKKRFAGPELQGKTLGVVGLGAIGAMVANMALELGMNVIGYDPAISVEAAWRLSRQVQKKDSLEALIGEADFISLHVPAIDSTKHLINSQRLASIRQSAVLLNFARESVVDSEAVIGALESGGLRKYVTDFPSAKLLGRDDVVAMPHIGASTPEAEENCSVMAVDQLQEFLEQGTIRNSVNFPAASMPRLGPTRITFANNNVPRVLNNVLSILADADMNVEEMLNVSRNDLAYNIIDVKSEVEDSLLAAIRQVEGVIRVRKV